MKFKNFVIVFSILYFSHSYLFSQGFRGGIVGGITASQIDNDELAGYNKLGVTGGFFVEYKLKEKFATQFEIKFMQKGAADPEQDYKRRLDYIDLGFLSKFSYKKFDFEGGVTPGFLINEKTTFLNVEEDEASYSKFDFPLSVGAYYHLADNWMFNARFSYSLLLLDGYLNNVLSFALYYYIN